MAAEQLNEVKAEGPGNWIKAFRRACGLNRFELAALAGVSETLIFILENQARAVTHPLLANRIAEICGATAEQRDSIVHEMHRGTWTPAPRPRKRAIALPPKRPQPAAPTATSGEDTAKGTGVRGANERLNAVKAEGASAGAKRPDAPETRGPQGVASTRGAKNRRPVVALDRAGTEVARYEGIVFAAEAEGMWSSCVAKRCARGVLGDEFKGSGRTYRYAEEWDAMTEAQRKADMMRAARRMR